MTAARSIYMRPTNTSGSPRNRLGCSNPAARWRAATYGGRERAAPCGAGGAQRSRSFYGGERSGRGNRTRRSLADSRRGRLARARGVTLVALVARRRPQDGL